jgi:hypothetical protein
MCSLRFENNLLTIRDVLDLHSGQAFFALPQRTSVVHNKHNRGHSKQQYVTMFHYKSLCYFLIGKSKLCF